MNKPKQRNIMYRGEVYRCILKNGKVTVRFQRTAQGQSVVAGTYDLVNDQWSNETNRAYLPKCVKDQIRESFNT